MTVEYTIKAYPTTYKGVRFRSRLEATWAAFFDQVGWQWEYEPADLGRWSPDFSLCGAFGQILVEVKPIDRFNSNVADKIDDAYPPLLERDGMRWGCEKEALILGIGPNFLYRGFVYGSTALGWLRDGGCWDHAVLGMWMEGNDSKVGFCHETQSYIERISGRYTGNCGGDGVLSGSDARLLWGEAKNLTQWRPR